MVESNSWYEYTEVLCYLKEPIRDIINQLKTSATEVLCRLKEPIRDIINQHEIVFRGSK